MICVPVWSETDIRYFRKHDQAYYIILGCYNLSRLNKSRVFIKEFITVFLYLNIALLKDIAIGLVCA